MPRVVARAGQRNGQGMSLPPPKTIAAIIAAICLFSFPAALTFILAIPFIVPLFIFALFTKAFLLLFAIEIPLVSLAILPVILFQGVAGICFTLGAAAVQIPLRLLGLALGSDTACCDSKAGKGKRDGDRRGKGRKGAPDELHVVAHGSTKGVPIVFLHGLVASSNWWLEGVVSSLKTKTENLFMIIPDLLGFGKSPWPADSMFSLDEHADSVHASLPLAKDAQFHLVGHSFGALVSLHLAARHPHRVASVTLTSVPYFTDSDEALSYFAGRFPTNMLVHAPWFVWLMCQVVCLPARRVFVPLAKAVIPSALMPRGALAYSDAFLHSYHSANATFRTIVNERVDRALHILKEHDVIVTAIHGRDDEVVPVLQTRKMAKAHQHVKVIEVNGNHNFPFHDHHDVSDTLLEIIRTVNEIK